MISVIKELDRYQLVSIPQAVSTVATKDDCMFSITINTIVSIPQAVSTVATLKNLISIWKLFVSFNTASGKYCCNYDNYHCKILQYHHVSIPQAVSTVATVGPRNPVFMGLKNRF